MMLMFSGALDIPLFYMRSAVYNLLFMMFGWIAG